MISGPGASTAGFRDLAAAPGIGVEIVYKVEGGIFAFKFVVIGCLCERERCICKQDMGPWGGGLN